MEAYSSIMGATERDRMYDCLPLYHTVGGVIALGACLVVGGSVFIREKFSASQFWDDVVEHDCTLFQYVGELCRYLLNAPVHPKEGLHKVRVCCGNGLRPDIWSAFKDRFRIRHIREFYAATEGNAIMFNLDDTPGAIGRCPFWIKPIFPIENIRFDIEGEREMRDATGFCIACAPDEDGELIAKIVNHAAKPGQRFDGYADREATAHKVLHDVFETGDRWFRTGDLVRRDSRGYFYFIDRIGDTYRWKGENVSTSEVAETINTYDDVREATVFGVAIDGHDGKAGMAAIVVGPDFDLEKLRAHIHERLPSFSRPLFLRMQAAIDATSTFKQRKFGLVRDGFDPERIADPLYFDDHRAGCYARLDGDLYREIQSGAVRL
jgi:fatty-acyl-CoA synthase